MTVFGHIKGKKRVRQGFGVSLSKITALRHQDVKNGLVNKSKYIKNLSFLHQ